MALRTDERHPTWPAALSYNYFLRRVKPVTASLDDFSHDFVNLAQRATYRIEHSEWVLAGR